VRWASTAYFSQSDIYLGARERRTSLPRQVFIVAAAQTRTRLLTTWDGSTPNATFSGRPSGSVRLPEKCQKIDRIDRNAREGRIYAGYPRSIPVHIIARNTALVDRNRKYRPRYRPRRNTLICRYFVSREDIAGDAVGICAVFCIG
jgi:hypothetical protein